MKPNQNQNRKKWKTKAKNIWEKTMEKSYHSSNSKQRLFTLNCGKKILLCAASTLYRYDDDDDIKSFCIINVFLLYFSRVFYYFAIRIIFSLILFYYLCFVCLFIAIPFILLFTWLMHDIYRLLLNTHKLIVARSLLRKSEKSSEWNEKRCFLLDYFFTTIQLCFWLWIQRQRNSSIVANRAHTRAIHDRMYLDFARKCW